MTLPKVNANPGIVELSFTYQTRKGPMETYVALSYDEVQDLVHHLMRAAETARRWAEEDAKPEAQTESQPQSDDTLASEHMFDSMEYRLNRARVEFNTVYRFMDLVRQQIVKTAQTKPK